MPESIEETAQSAYAWFCEQVRTRYQDGNELTLVSRVYKSQRLPWLLDQIKKRDGGMELAEAFRQRCNAEAVERSWKIQRARLASLEASVKRLEQDLGKSSDYYLDYIKIAAQRLRKSIEKHDQQEVN